MIRFELANISDAVPSFCWAGLPSIRSSLHELFPTANDIGVEQERCRIVAVAIVTVTEAEWCLRSRLMSDRAFTDPGGAAGLPRFNFSSSTFGFASAAHNG